MKNSAIEWTDHTFNAWIGCTKVSPGCANCYAESLDHRWGHDSWGKGKPRRLTSVSNWKQPLKWDREAAEAKAAHDGEDLVHAPFVRPRVFCASLADWLDDEVPIEWLADLLNLIRLTPNLDWLLLTKRPQNWLTRLDAAASRLVGVIGGGETHAMIRDWLSGAIVPANVWIGTSVEDFQAARRRLHHLVRIPATVRFLSCEPLLSDPLISAHCLEIPWAGGEARGGRDYSPALGFIDWVIVGGESGPKARPMDVAWARSIRDECHRYRIPFFFKQWGEYDQAGNRVGKKAAGRLLDGVEHNGFPR